MFVGCEDEKNRLETDAFFIQQDNDGWHSIALLVSLLWQLSKIQFVFGVVVVVYPFWFVSYLIPFFRKC